MSTESTGPTVRSHHHGDLRAALLRAARVRVRQHGYEVLSLRELAREIGVASSAPYAHFANRDDVLREVIATCVADLSQRYMRALALPVSPVQRLIAACRDYLALARSEPELFRLMFVSSLEPAAPSVGEDDHAFDTHRMFERLVGDAMRSAGTAGAGEVDAAEVTAVTVSCWAVVHGFAVLHLNGRLALFLDPSQTESSMIEALLRQVGLRPDA